MPEIVALRTGLSPPRIVTPPPPFPISTIVAQPLPLFDMLLPYFSMTLSEVWIDFQLQYPLLFVHYFLQHRQSYAAMFLASLLMKAQYLNWKNLLALLAMRLHSLRFEGQLLMHTEFAIFHPAEWAVFLCPRLDTLHSEDMSAVNAIGVRHHLKADTAEQLLLGLLALNKLPFYAFPSHCAHERNKAKEIIIEIKIIYIA